MANRNMTFNASLRLNTKEFKKGVADVQRSLKMLQSSFLSVAGALGLGMSLNRLGSALMDTATKMSVAKNTLKNVSKEFGEYGESLSWLRKISNQYGQDLITLTNSFAQFRAAAESSSLTLDEMRTIYEALTRAAGAYHMSADRTNDMMIAVTQMLSKGKVAAEELRRQLGNSLPGAFNLMAEAAYNAGVITENSTRALEDAMKSGKVMAEDVLPSFAKVLNDVTANADFDSLQTSLNRLKNTWTEVVEAGNFENLYKTIIDGARGVLTWFTSDFKPKIYGALAGAFSGTIGLGWAKKFIKQTKEMKADAVADFNRISQSLGEMDQKMANYFVKAKRMGGHNIFSVDEDAIKRANISLEQQTKAFRQSRDAAVKYNQELLKLNATQKTAGVKPFLSKKDIAAIQKLNEQMDPTISALDILHGKTTAWGAALKVVGKVGKMALNMIGTALSSIAIGALIGGITTLIAKLIETRKEAKSLKNQVEDTVKEINNVSVAENSTVVQLTRIKAALRDINESTDNDTKTKLINEVNEALGKSKDNLFTIASSIEDEVIPAIDSWINKLRAVAVQAAIIQKVEKLTGDNLDLNLRKQELLSDPNHGKTRRGGNVYKNGGVYEIPDRLTPAAQRIEKELGDIDKKMEKNEQTIRELMGPTDLIMNPDFNGPIPPWRATPETIATILGLNPTKKGTGNQGPQGGGGGKDKTPQDVLDDYKKELKELDNQLAAGAVDAAKYSENLAKLNQKTFEDLAAFGWENAMEKLPKSADKQLAEGIRTAVLNAYLESLDDPALSAGIDEEVQEAGDKLYDALHDAWEKFRELMKDEPVEEKRNTFFDYMYSNRKEQGQTYSERDTEAMSELQEIKEKYADNIDEFIAAIREFLETKGLPVEIVRALNEELDNLAEKLGKARTEAEILQHKINIAQIEKEIADLRKERIEQIFTDITTMSDGMDKLYRAVQSVKQINDSTWKSEDLENFITKMNALIQVLEVLKTLYSALKTTEEIYGKIKEKNAAKAIALNAAEAASEEAVAAAAGKGALAKVAGAVAGVPLAGPALAIAAVTALAAVLKGMNKFAKGGIVGGNSFSGDKQLARVNSSEMILNRAQQGHLWNMINGKEGKSGGSVEFKIRGADLVGTLNNYRRLTNGRG